MCGVSREYEWERYEIAIEVGDTRNMVDERDIDKKNRAAKQRTKGEGRKKGLPKKMTTKHQRYIV